MRKENVKVRKNEEGKPELHISPRQAATHSACTPCGPFMFMQTLTVVRCVTATAPDVAE